MNNGRHKKFHDNDGQPNLHRFNIDAEKVLLFPEKSLNEQKSM